MHNIESPNNYKNKYFLYLLFLSVSFVFSLPHFMVSHDLWDGVYYYFFLNNGEYSKIELITAKINAGHFKFIYLVLGYIKDLFNVNLGLIFDIYRFILIFFTICSLYLFFTRALFLNKIVSTLFSIITILLPIYTLLASSVFFHIILLPILIFFSIGLYFSKLSKYKIVKIISWILLFYTIMFPIYFPFVIILIIMTILINNFNNKGKLHFDKKNIFDFLFLSSSVLGGILFYYLNSNDISAGYKYYVSIDHIKFSLRMFHDYSIQYYSSLIIPALALLIIFFKNYKYAIYLSLLIFALFITSIAPYVLFYKAPLCLIDSNCKEYLYDFKERHTMMLGFFIIIINAIIINNLFLKYKKLNIFAYFLSFLILINSTVFSFAINHSRNIIRDNFIDRLKVEIMQIDKKYNYIQVLMPNTKNIYRFKGRDLNLIAYELGLRHIIFDANIVDDRVPDKTHKDYFIVPNSPNFEDHMKEVSKKFEKPFDITERIYRDYKPPLCGARYVLSIDTKENQLFDFFNMRNYKENKRLLISVTNPEYNIQFTKLESQKNC